MNYWRLFRSYPVSASKGISHLKLMLRVQGKFFVARGRCSRVGWVNCPLWPCRDLDLCLPEDMVLQGNSLSSYCPVATLTRFLPRPVPTSWISAAAKKQSTAWQIMDMALWTAQDKHTTMIINTLLSLIFIVGEACSLKCELTDLTEWLLQ